MTEDTGPGPLPWRRHLILALIVLTGAAAFGRQHLRKQREQHAEAVRQQQPAPGTANALVPGQAPPADPTVEEPSGLEKALPFLTEAGLAMLLGIGLGLATRSFIRLALIVFAIGFLTLQYLGYKGLVDVNLGAWAVWLKDFVLHIADEADWRGVVSHKTPTAAAFVIGYFIGLKRG